jgi:hypothetical protein
LKHESEKEREYSAQKIGELKKSLRPVMQEEWGLLDGTRMMRLRKQPGRAPKWQCNEKNGKLVPSKGGGVEWWKYQIQVIIPKLVRFAKECMEERLQSAVQEDKAPSHAHHAQTLLL